MDCLFCKIIKKEVPAAVIFEDNDFLAFNDINPIAPVHLLIIPKKHIASVDYLQENDKELVGSLILLAKRIAKDKGLDKTGYRLTFNAGPNAGQTVEHLHLHLIGGKKLLWR